MLSVRVALATLPWSPAVMTSVRRLAPGMALGILAGVVAGLVWTPVTQSETAKKCDSEQRVCVTRTQAPRLVLVPAKDQLRVSIDVWNCGRDYPTPFELPAGELEVTFEAKFVQLRGPHGDVARYDTTGNC